MGFPDAVSIERISIVKRLLEEWADWMHEGSVGRGYPKRSVGISSGYVSASFDEMCEESDAQRCRVVDSCVDDLPPAQNAAIYRCYLAAVYRLRDYENSLVDAHALLEESFQRKGILW